MDNFDAVKIEGTENIVGKNIAYKNHVVINIYTIHKVKAVTDTFFLLLFLLIGFIGTLFAIESYFHHDKPAHSHLVFIIIFCALLGAVSVVFFVKNSDLQIKNNFKVLAIISLIIAVIVTLFFINSEIFFLERSTMGLSLVIPLLVVSFINFLLGIFLYLVMSK